MELVGILQRILDREGATFRECRDCGQTLPAGDETCPNCDSEEIACYEF